MQNLISTILGGGLLGVIAWAFQLGNRVSVLEAKAPDLKELINAQFADVSRRLSRIESAMNGHLPGSN